MSPINTEVVMVHQLTEATRVLDVILAVLVGAVVAIAALAGAALWLVL